MVKIDKSDKYKTFIGIDYGDANLGLAIGRNGLVSPIRVLSEMSAELMINEINRVATENKSDTFVLGLPLDAENKETRQSIEVRKFAKLPKTLTKKKVIFQNEYASTLDASTERLSSDRKKRYDHYSAALILKRYFDSL